MAQAENPVEWLMEVADCARDTALHYLSLADGDHMGAFEMLLEHKEKDGPGSTSAAATGNRRASSPRAHDVDDDDDGVRRPDAVKRQRLLDLPDMRRDIGVNPFRNFGAEARGAFGRAGPVAEGGGHGIAQIFEPPRRLLFRGSYHDARSTARVQNKWLLINIQRDDIFESHVLNRDVWKDELVAEVIESSFVFWQAPYQAPEAMQYMSRHQVAQSALPHIGVLDPRTQRLLWSHTGGIHKDMLTEKLTDLCSRIKWDDASTLPPPPMQNTAPQVYDKSYDEQLALAIAASLKEQKEEVVVLDDDEEGEEEEDSDVQMLQSSKSLASRDSDVQILETVPKKSDGKAVAPVVNVDDSDDHTAGAAGDGDEASSGEEFEGLELAPEPENGAGTTRLQIRLPDGKRFVRRFAVSDPVGVLFKFVSLQLAEEDRRTGFDIATMMPARSLTGDMQKSLSEAGLDNAVLITTWK